MLTVKEVKTRADKKRFIQFQNDLYKDCENYVPTLMMDEMANLNPKKNPSFDFCESRQWLVYRDEEIVGRVAAIVSHAANDIWGENRIRFSRIDFIEDYEVFCLLMKQVEDWARELGLTEIIGPMGFCDFDKEGMLVDGFDKMGMFITYYNYPYYPEFLERYGFEKEVDWVENKVYIEGRQNVEKLDKLCDRMMGRMKLSYVELKNKRQVKAYIPKIFDLINEAYQELFQVVPITQHMKDYYVGQFLMLINMDYIGLVVDEDGKLIGLGVNAPSLVETIKKHNGRLFPFGWIDLLKTIRHPKALDMYFVAVDKEYKNAGVPALLLNRLWHRGHETGIEFAETGPELEYNYKVQGLWKDFKIDHNHKRRRCFKKAID